MVGWALVKSYHCNLLYVKGTGEMLIFFFLLGGGGRVEKVVSLDLRRTRWTSFFKKANTKIQVDGLRVNSFLYREQFWKRATTLGAIESIFVEDQYTFLSLEPKKESQIVRFSASCKLVPFIKLQHQWASLGSSNRPTLLCWPSLPSYCPASSCFLGWVGKGRLASFPFPPCNLNVTSLRSCLFGMIWLKIRGTLIKNGSSQ